MSPPSAVGQDPARVTVASSLAGPNYTDSPEPPAAAPVTTTATELAELDPSKVKITLTRNPKPFHENPGAPDTTTDHWITAKWNYKTGWQTPELKPSGPIDLWPAASCLHYATECFEGLKAYRGFDGSLRLFRPNCNAARMIISSTRIALPSCSPSALEELIKLLISHDAPKWLPKPGTCLYIRPTMIGTGTALGVQIPKEAMLFILAAVFPVLDVKPMRLLASRENSIRSWPGGFGYAKVGANYGPSLLAHNEAQSKGYDQILWIFDKSCQVTEAGASNFFVIWRNKDTNKLQLITAPLDNRIILDGITRRSVLEIAKDRLTGTTGELEGLEIIERTYTMTDLIDAHKDGRLIEAFAAGTAYFISPVYDIHFRGIDIQPLQRSGCYTTLIKGWLKGIMYGKERNEWAVVVKEVGFKTEAIDETEVEAFAKKIRELKGNAAWAAALERVAREI